MKKFKNIMVIIASLTVIVCGCIYITNTTNFNTKNSEQENLRRSYEADKNALQERFDGVLEGWGC